MTNKINTVLYVGVTVHLKRRIFEHKNGLSYGFTKKYNCFKLVYYEVFESVDLAIQREKQLKGGSRLKKEQLIEKMNHGWEDLYKDLI